MRLLNHLFCIVGMSLSNRGGGESGQKVLVRKTFMTSKYEEFCARFWYANIDGRRQKG